ncbi:hypothetical protein V2J09_009321 [Rumex salicifolius]
MAMIVVVWVAVTSLMMDVVVANLNIMSSPGNELNYRDALTKSLLFLEAQRSGKLPPNNRIPWRGDSGLDDGKEANVDLVGGYYDAGDNVKYGMPMAFTVTTLAWATIQYGKELEVTGELVHAREAIKWGTDYFLKAASLQDGLYVQVGNPMSDHACWIRPENMQTPRTVLKIDANTPGTEIAAETSAALAAASIVFRQIDHEYSHNLLNKAKRLFTFAKSKKETYDGECPFYCSYSGFNDELQWAATWLLVATKNTTYLNYVIDESVDAYVNEFNWDLKYAGTQILLTTMFLEGEKRLYEYKPYVDSYICAILPESPFHQISLTPGGLIYMREGANTQYVTGTSMLFTIYADVLAKYNLQASCGNQQFGPDKLLLFAKKQMDYILGKNPQQMSYMVGFGTKFPKQPHHRGASVPVMPPGEHVTCSFSFISWFTKDQPNPNELTGAIVGGPDRNDNFQDRRFNGPGLEPCTYINSMAVAPLAKLASPFQQVPS